jgi:DNA helicase HerA-like ATPase
LVEVRIGKRLVTYQLVSGVTKEEIVQQKNTHGFARAQAQKIGEWDATAKRFKFAKWLPQPNAPVFLKASAKFAPQIDAVGHFPGTDYGISLRKKDGNEVGLHALVTHNTAILGILGVGKSSIALELVERMMAEGIKVVCLDLTNQYATGLSPYYDAAKEAERIKALQTLGQTGRTNVKKNVEEGGSRNAFAKAITEDLSRFMQEPARLKIYNPAQFEVWKQDSKPFQDTASMASLTPPEITHIVSDATLQIVSRLGMTEQARVCLVYEEAHSLVPEWNSAVAEGDRASANGSARAILQGRKYGLGCLLISQRTANVTKTILNQCNTVFALRTFDETGKDFLANYLGREYADVLPSLEERQAVFFGRASNCENPVLIRANDREDFLRVFRKANPLPPIDGKAEATSVPPSVEATSANSSETEASF